MLLSPPFLPPPRPNESDADFVERAMQGGEPGTGGYPVSFQLDWHGGLHLAAPPAASGGGTLPVRAIADGTVVHRSAQVTAQNSNPAHPLNYRGGWTDDGCVVIRHETDIGADANDQPTTVVFYSIYMHLRTIDGAIRANQPIYRKAMIGTAGQIYGVPDRLHFEILCDDENVRKLTGRDQPYLVATTDGRTDAVYGALWFILLLDTPFYATEPQAGAPLPPVVYRNHDEALFVRMDYVAGDAEFRTFHLDGRSLAGPLVDPQAEYNLFSTATARFPNSPSAGYELMRFGRVLGPDALAPPNAPHWRQVPYAGGAGWVNLNDARVKKWSDADFPTWDSWWVLVDGSSSATSKCREYPVLDLLDLNHDLSVPPQEAQQAITNVDVQRRLSRKICKFRSEWDPDDFDTRYGWLKTDQHVLMNAATYAQFKAHVSALAFWKAANLGMNGRPWHFPPRHFIRHFRRCGWLSLNELTQLMPRWPEGNQRRGTDIPWRTAERRFRAHVVNLNRTLRKYNILSASRQTHFLAQTFIETGLWQTMREFSRGRPNANGTWSAPAMQYYTVFYGRGIMQLTWPSNYDGYGRFRRCPPVGANVVYGDQRLTHVSTHYWADPVQHGVVVGVPRLWFPRFDPEIVADDGFAACDSGGYYWISKDTGHQRLNIHRVADQGVTTASVGRASVLVNGGTYGFVERQRWAAYIDRFRSDDTSMTPNGQFQATHRTHVYNVTVDYAPQHR